MTERVQLYEAGRNGKCMYDSQRAPAWRVTGGKKEAFQSNMGCFNTAPLKYRDALRLMRNLDPSRQNYCLLLLFEDFFSPWLSYYWNVLNYYVTIVGVFALMCILKSRGHNLAVAVSSRH